MAIIGRSHGQMHGRDIHYGGRGHDDRSSAGYRFLLSKNAAPGDIKIIVTEEAAASWLQLRTGP